MAPWIALVVTLLIVGVAVFAYVRPEAFEDNPAAPAAPLAPQDDPRVVKGSSCELLAAARRALENGTNEQFVSSLRAAERAAERALDTNFVWFGRPEELALRIGAEELDKALKSRARERIEARLEVAGTACQKLRS